MAAPSQTLFDAPNFTGIIDQRFFLEPLGGAASPYSYLNRFPDSVYNLSPLGHLVKFLYTFMGPAGVGGIRRTYLQARLILQEHGFDLFSLDQIYSNPFAFGRILEEQYEFDPTGLVTQQQWDQIKAADSSYRNRAVDFMNAARAGNSPLGIQLAARSGLGYEVEVIENYRFLYDQHSDDPIGIPYKGSSLSTEEIVILPRQSLSQSETQTIGISVPPAGGFFTLSFDGRVTQPIAPTATRLDIQNFLEALPNIGKGNVLVTGGPGPDIPWEINFTGALGGRSLPQIVFNNSLLTADAPPEGQVATTIGGVEASDDVIDISPQDQKYMVDALDKIKPVTTIVTSNLASGIRSRTDWKSITASSEFTEVIPFVTGTTEGATDWIQTNIENQAPTTVESREHHYVGIHNIKRAIAYTDQALLDPIYETDKFTDFGEFQYGENPYSSEHFGLFSPTQESLFPIFNQQVLQYFKFFAKYAINPSHIYPFPIIRSIADGLVFVNDRYPLNLYNQLFKFSRNPDYYFWASLERIGGTEILEIDLGSVQAVNYISFETTHKPLSVSIDYDILDDSTGRRKFYPVSPSRTLTFEDNITYSTDVAHPWQFVEYNFGTSKSTMIWTRYLRISFTRTEVNSPFTDNSGTKSPFSVDVRNLKAGRQVFIGDDNPFAPVISITGQPIGWVGPYPSENVSPDNRGQNYQITLLAIQPVKALSSRTKTITTIGQGTSASVVGHRIKHSILTATKSTTATVRPSRAKTLSVVEPINPVLTHTP